MPAWLPRPRRLRRPAGQLPRSCGSPLRLRHKCWHPLRQPRSQQCQPCRSGLSAKAGLRRGTSPPPLQAPPRTPRCCAGCAARACKTAAPSRPQQ
eukprot:359718-Chlamydomonas_euryale.AAC.16